MDLFGSGIPVYVVCVLFIILFHRGRYPPPLVSPGNPKRECTEAATIFGVMLIVYWLQTLSRSIFTWSISACVYLVLGLCLLLVAEMLVRRRRISFVGFKVPTNRKALLIFTVVLTLFLIGGIAVRLMRGIGFRPFDIYFVVAVIIGPFVEETVFRGLIQTRFEAGLGTIKSLVLTSLLFGFYHYWAHFLILGRVLTVLGLTQVAGTVIYGMLFGVAFAKTRSLLPPFLLHAANNYVAFIEWN
jgi:membrane protease YdiL (CAAX protease family)